MLQANISCCTEAVKGFGNLFGVPILKNNGVAARFHAWKEFISDLHGWFTFLHLGCSIFYAKECSGTSKM